MYKDPDKQREANRQAKMRQRVKIASMEGETQSQGMTIEQMQGMTPEITSHPVIPKRGKDITCFEDLPQDVRRTIDIMSRDSTGKLDQDDLAKRTARAIHYQHLFPDRFYSTGVA